MTVYEIVTQQILDKLDKGVVPWHQPWDNNGAINWGTGKPYRGINAILLDPGEYATFNQIDKAGGKVKKGSKSHLVVFWKFYKKESEEGEETEIKGALMRYYRVFNILTQCEGLESKRKIINRNNDPIEEAENIVKGYKNGPEIIFAPGRAFYRPASDEISVPHINDYPLPEEYYSTLFHEMGHSTGHKDRLNRSGIESIAAFGSDLYSKEELIAEIASAMLCGVAGIENKTLDNSAAYIKSWSEKLRQDSKLIVQAAGQAQKAADYIRGISY